MSEIAARVENPVRSAFVVVSNRLPVDRVTEPDGSVRWRTSPGGLVTAMEPVVRDLGCVWVGWPGSIDEELEPFAVGAMRLRPVALSAKDFAEYYEGCSNDTFWPLYHDVISPPGYHREWWDRYVAVNRRFAEAAAEAAEPGATVWVHDYQLQLVPAMLRELRPDLVIAFFLHIPFPAHGLFGQLPWRRQVLEGIIGADVVGFQRVADAANFRSAVRRYVGAPSNGNRILVGEAPDGSGGPERHVLAQEFPISIDAEEFAALAASEPVQRRAREIRAELGDPERVILGVDRLDYTKGIRHRLKAFSELLQDGEIDPAEVTLVQVASPSRERVEAYQHLRDEIEVTVGRINGDFGTIGHSPVVYLHRGYPREEMAALYLAADVLAVTALRDGMNLVAKEYAACRFDERGALVLSEFAGAADELRRAVLVNPHDINGLKAGIVAALRMPEAEQRQRMRAMRKVVFRNDVARWSSDFLRSVEGAAAQRILAEEPDAAVGDGALDPDDDGAVANPAYPPTTPIFLPTGLDAVLRRLAAEARLLVACDFDGTLAPIVPHPDQARILPRAEQALSVLQNAPGVDVAIVSGRSIADLRATGLRTDGRILSGSHGAELAGLPGDTQVPTASATRTPDEDLRYERVRELFERHAAGRPGAWVEQKPFGLVLHGRGVAEVDAAEAMLAAAAAEAEDLREQLGGLRLRGGKLVTEASVRDTDKGVALHTIRTALPEGSAVMIGDDDTDEDAFRALGSGDAAIRVGTAPSVAEFRVADPEEVAAMLARLAELRTGVVIGS